MPTTDEPGPPEPDELPSTLARSDAKAQRTFSKTYDSALDTYDGNEQRAGRTAWSVLKHTHEKVGDHWEPKDENGPSDPQAADGGADTNLGTHGGVDANATKAHLQQLARRMGVPGRSAMTKDQLVAALEKANEAETRRARKN